MITFGAYFSLWIGTLALAWTYLQADMSAYVWATLGIGTLWTSGLLQRKKWMPGFGLILLTLLAAAGLYQSLPFGWVFAAALSGLMSYDLSNFSLRLRYLAHAENTHQLQRVHLTRLGVMTLLGLTLSTLAMLWQAEFTFEWAIFLMLAGVWGISLLVGWVRQRE
ncbi:MAG: hypothetical protein HN855_01240 [Anaerolineae bacterium]|jgi:hypothetical protein|nr:hypothetical protein [Anaerolineae bacterium]MBT7071060.1 hypothetical protein [Anaerolineae bacterium]MBT7323766.1 hypothetical protein [Anaerolineae bacterium]